FLSGFHVRNCKEMESVRQKTSGEIHNHAGNICHGASSDLDMQRIVARRQMQLYFLRSVLFYSDSAGDCRAAGKGPGAEYLSYPGGFPGVAESSDHKNMGHYFCRRAVLPGGWIPGRAAYVPEYI